MQQLIDSSYGEEFDYYDSFTATDLAFAVQGMQSISDEYEPAHIYLRDLDSAYYGGVLSMKEGKYKDAIVQFEDIIAYSDSAEKIDECRVLLANEQAASGQMDQALSTVALVKDWTAYIDILPEDNSLTSLLAADNQDNSNNNA
ncbi:MAG: hypothetical protein II920_05700 [Clostridia bacterium]|nr:hypothetical protein [Clostridia bacterium]